MMIPLMNKTQQSMLYQDSDPTIVYGPCTPHNKCIYNSPSDGSQISTQNSDIQATKSPTVDSASRHQQSFLFGMDRLLHAATAMVGATLG